MIKGQFTLEIGLNRCLNEKNGSAQPDHRYASGQMGQAARQADPKDIEKGMKQSEGNYSFMTLGERQIRTY